MQRPTDAPPPPTRPAAAFQPGGQLLFARDIAALRGVTARQARRWLERLEIHGTDAVGRIEGRRGPQRYTTEAALQTIEPATARRENSQLAEAAAELADRVARLEERLERVT